MRARLWVVNLFAVATILSWPHSVNAVTISFREAEAVINGMEEFPKPPTPQTTVTTTGLGPCVGGAPPCVLGQANGTETASIDLRVPGGTDALGEPDTGTFIDPDRTRLPRLGPPPDAADKHVARALLLERGGFEGDISDIVELRFIFGNGGPDQISIKFMSDSPENNLGKIPDGFVFEEVETNRFPSTPPPPPLMRNDVVLNSKFFTGPIGNSALQHPYCQNPVRDVTTGRIIGGCASANLPMNWTITARSDPETVPEPSTLALLAISIVGLALYRWRVIGANSFTF